MANLAGEGDARGVGAHQLQVDDDAVADTTPDRAARGRRRRSRRRAPGTATIRCAERPNRARSGRASPPAPVVSAGASSVRTRPCPSLRSSPTNPAHGPDPPSPCTSPVDDRRFPSRSEGLPPGLGDRVSDATHNDRPASAEPASVGSGHERGRSRIGRAPAPVRGGVRAVPPNDPRVPGPRRRSRRRRRVRGRRVRRRLLGSGPLRPGARQRAGVVVRHRHQHPADAGTLAQRGAARGAASVPSATPRTAASRWSRRGLDYGRRLAWVAEFIRELSDTDRDVLVLYAWGGLTLSRDRASPRGRGRHRRARGWHALAGGCGNCSRPTAKYRVGEGTPRTTRTNHGRAGVVEGQLAFDRTVSRHHQTPSHAAPRRDRHRREPTAPRPRRPRRDRRSRHRVLVTTTVVVALCAIGSRRGRARLVRRRRRRAARARSACPPPAVPRAPRRPPAPVRHPPSSRSPTGSEAQPRCQLPWPTHLHPPPAGHQLELRRHFDRTAAAARRRRAAKFGTFAPPTDGIGSVAEPTAKIDDAEEWRVGRCSSSSRASRRAAPSCRSPSPVMTLPSSTASPTACCVRRSGPASRWSPPPEPHIGADGGGVRRRHRVACRMRSRRLAVGWSSGRRSSTRPTR